MEARKLVVERCEQMLASKKEIDCLDLAGNLRQLLADQHRLIDTANATGGFADEVSHNGSPNERKLAPGLAALSAVSIERL
jgi:hypothetical protein